jgi:hypothetical protein
VSYRRKRARSPLKLAVGLQFPLLLKPHLCDQEVKKSAVPKDFAERTPSIVLIDRNLEDSRGLSKNCEPAKFLLGFLDILIVGRTSLVRHANGFI